MLFRIFFYNIHNIQHNPYDITRKILGAENWGSQMVGGRLSHLHLTYIAGQMLLALGMCQGHSAGRQDIAGGFHSIPGLLVQVL